MWNDSTFWSFFYHFICIKGAKEKIEKNIKYKKIIEKKLSFKMKCLKSFVWGYLIWLGGVDRLFSLIFQATMFMGRRNYFFQDCRFSIRMNLVHLFLLFVLHISALFWPIFVFSVCFRWNKPIFCQKFISVFHFTKGRTK